MKHTSKEERLQKQKEHFKNLLVNPSEITDKPIEKTFNGQQDIWLWRLTEK